MIVPEIGRNEISFTYYSQQLESPFTMYADFESVMKKESEKKTIHEIYGYSLFVKSPYEDDQYIIIERQMQGNILLLTFRVWVKK